jgi:hypothetical protein
VIDLREKQQQNVFISMRVNSKFVSNKIDESDVQYEIRKGRFGSLAAPPLARERKLMMEQ